MSSKKSDFKTKGNEKDKKSTSEMLSRFNKLKKMKRDSTRQNKHILSEDLKKTKLLSLESRKNDNIDDYKEMGQENKKGENPWDWTIEENEKWENKKKKLQKHKELSGFHDTSKLAELSYNKEIWNLEIDKDEYDRQKKKPRNMQNGANSKDFLSIHEINDKTDDSTVSQLVERIKDSNSRRLKRRREHNSSEASGTYINEKNKQFNLKLNRQYKKAYD